MPPSRGWRGESCRVRFWMIGVGVAFEPRDFRAGEFGALK